MRKTSAWAVVILSLAAVSYIAVGCGDDADKTGPGDRTATTRPADKGKGPGPDKGGQAPKKRGKIGLSVLTLANPFFKVIGDTMTEEAAKYGFEVVVVSGDMDAGKQRNQVKDFIATRCAAIVLTPCDSGGVGEAIKEANEAGIPVFTADIACLAKGVDVVSHIATDNYGGGKLAAKALVEALKARGDARGEVAIIDHDEVESVKQRTDGFLVQLAEENKAADVDLDLVARVPGKGQRDKGREAMMYILQSNPNIKGVFAINDPSALGAVAALEAVKNTQVVVIGFDGQLDGKQAIKAGKIYADPIQFPEKIARLTVQAIVDYSKGKKPKKEILIDTALYRKADAEKDPALK